MVLEASSHGGGASWAAASSTSATASSTTWPHHPASPIFSSLPSRSHSYTPSCWQQQAAFLVGPFLLHHRRRGFSLAQRASATKTKAPPTAPPPTKQQPQQSPPPPPLSFPSNVAAASTAASLPRRLVAKPLVDARQLTPHDIEARFAGVDFAVPRTLPQALRTFWSNPSIQLIAAGLIGILAARVTQGGPVTAIEALAVPLTVTGWVVQEWAIHRHLLHGSWQWPGAAIHQQHHELPFYHVSIDPPAIVLAWGAVACAVGLVLLPQPLAWTVLGTYWLMGLVYEWSHYIVHTRVRPRTPIGRAIKEHHTRHHLQDDRYWFAFSWPPIDALLNTTPPAPVAGSKKEGKSSSSNNSQ